MKYTDYAKQQENRSLKTEILTRINDNKRISSCFRKFANSHFKKWGWETFLWDEDLIVEQYAVLSTADEVVNLHIEILNNHGRFNLSGEEDTK